MAMPDQELSSARVLRQAVEKLGGRQELSVLLGVSTGQLARWIAGVEMPPHEIFVRALEFVSCRATEVTAPRFPPAPGPEQ